jgi:hypothetical protein
MPNDTDLAIMRSNKPFLLRYCGRVFSRLNPLTHRQLPPLLGSLFRLAGSTHRLQKRWSNASPKAATSAKKPHPTLPLAGADAPFSGF